MSVITRDGILSVFIAPTAAWARRRLLCTLTYAAGLLHMRNFGMIEASMGMQVWTAERDGAIEKPDQTNGFHRGKGRDEMNVFSEKSGDPLWKLVRKGTAPAFAPQNLR